MFNPQPKPEKQPKKKRKYIRPISEKRSKQRKEYRVIRDQFLIDNPMCNRCGMPASEVHHTNHTENERLLNVEYFEAICRNCHRAEHDKPKLINR